MGNSESKEIDISEQELEILPLGELLQQPSGGDANMSLVLDRSAVKLFARRNRIQTLPLEIAQFTKLVEISFRDNLLQEFPQVLCQLKSLVKLSLSFNRITNVPSDIKNMQNLALLSLAGNQLEVLPEEIGQLGKLQGLDLQRNRLQLLPKTIGHLKSLTTLLLHKNRLQAAPDLSALKHLRTLNLGFNQIRFLPGSVCGLHSLEELILSSNQLTMLPIGMFPQMQRLRVFDAHTNQIRSLPADIRMVGRSLRRLNLAINKLTNLPMEIGELVRLEWLNLNDNLLETLPPTIGGLRRLRKLGLVQNLLNSFPQEVGLMRELTKLDVRRNRVRYFPPTMRHMQNLLAVLMDGNPLCTQFGPLIGESCSSSAAEMNDRNESALTTPPPRLLPLIELSARQVWMTQLRDKLVESVRFNESLSNLSSERSASGVESGGEFKCPVLDLLEVPYPLKSYMDQPSLCNLCLHVCCKVHYDYVDSCTLMAVRRSMTGLHHHSAAAAANEEQLGPTQKIPIRLRFCTLQCRERYVRGETPPVSYWHSSHRVTATSSQSLSIGSHSSLGGSSSLDSAGSSNNALSPPVNINNISYPAKSPQYLAVPVPSTSNEAHRLLRQALQSATAANSSPAMNDLWMTFIAGEYRNYDPMDASCKHGGLGDSDNTGSGSSLQAFEDLKLDHSSANQSLPTRWLMRQMRNSLPTGHHTASRLNTISTSNTGDADVSSSNHQQQTAAADASEEQRVLESF